MEVVHRVEICDSREAAAWSQTVNSLKPHWISRDAFALYSLGAAAYLDAPTAETVGTFGIDSPEPTAYENRLSANNSILQAHFPVLYQRLLAELSELLGADVEMAAGKALPGFHIFEHHTQYGIPTAHVAHYDRQFENLSWPQAIEVTTTKTISFTLPIKLPKAGGGLLLWDVKLNEVLSKSREQAKAYIKAAGSHREEYQVGQLVCHPGYQLHRIAPWQSEPGDQRMTLQGHALKLQNRWLAYW